MERHGTLVVATDLSPGGARAVDLAVLVARDLDAPIRLVHAADRGPPAAISRDASPAERTLRDRLRQRVEAAQRRLEEERQRVARQGVSVVAALLDGRPWEAMGVSLVLHPRNPYVPTVHLNVRCFVAEKQGADPVWWFGGGMDLTPYYGFAEDATHFHRSCRDALAPFGAEYHPKFKQWCDRYFFLKHRNEPRGVGGIFFDDLGEPDFDHCFALTRSVGDHFLSAYVPVIERRRDLPYGERERDFQAYRRGRYVEFNLVFDRGTLFGLQSGGRTESILMSLPPVVNWRYDWHPQPGTPEASLYADFLIAKDWL